MLPTIKNLRGQHTRHQQVLLPTTTVPSQLQALIEYKAFALALAERDASRSRDGDTSLVRRLKESVGTYPMGRKDGIVFSYPATVALQVSPQSMQEAIEFATEMMDKKMLTAAERQAENKRKFEDTSRNNQNQQQPFKRNNVARAYTAGPGDKKPYGGTKPLCAKCNYHHDGPCTQKCTNCKKLGHSARDCKVRPTANNNNNNNNNHQRTQGTNPRVITCFECGVQARAYVVGSAGTNPNSNVVTGTFLLNNRYASILFDTGADRSFISTAFSSLIDIIPTTLDHGYDVELADDRIIWVNTLIRGLHSKLSNQSNNLYLMHSRDG
ncbi:putative reverse transcriptase domain-containing protein [Tanacetum coccineum]